MVGARESYARAIESGEWAGFSCSLTAEESGRSSAVGAALRRSAKDLLETWSETSEASPAEEPAGEEEAAPDAEEEPAPAPEEEAVPAVASRKMSNEDELMADLIAAGISPERTCSRVFS